MGAKQKTPKKAEKKAADDKIRVKKAADEKAADKKKPSDAEADVEVPTELASDDSGEGRKKRKARDGESSSTSPANPQVSKAWTTMFSG